MKNGYGSLIFLVHRADEQRVSSDIENGLEKGARMPSDGQTSTFYTKGQLLNAAAGSTYGGAASLLGGVVLIATWVWATPWGGGGASWLVWALGLALAGAGLWALFQGLRFSRLSDEEQQTAIALRDAHVAAMAERAEKDKAAQAPAAKKEAEQRRAFHRTHAPTAVKCPACGTARPRRVGVGERVGSGVAGGILFSQKARAQFQCEYCRYLW